MCVKVTFNSTVRVDAKKEQQPDKISFCTSNSLSYGKQVFSAQAQASMNIMVSTTQDTV